MKSGNLNLKDVKKLFRSIGQVLKSYRGFLLFIVVAALYGFIVWRINVYSNVQPSEQEATAQAAAQPHIEQSTIDKIQSLQDNSVSVQALFDQARSNPFNE